MSSANTPGRGDIAIVGLAGRFPGARDVDEYWANLCAGVESISFFSDEELLAAGVSAAEFSRADYVRAGSEVEGVDLFDAEFFGYTAREAQITDPQQRLFLETAWGALEHAGYDSARYPGRIGVFGGAGSNGYLRNVYSNPDAVEAVGLTQILVANELNFLASRVSYKLDLRGPSVAMRTACSTALVAVHMACQSLLNGECEMALAGAAHVYIGQNTGYIHQDGSFVSPDGHCRPFDARARGTVFGSGVGAVVLKRLSDAVADNDTVYAVIKGSAVNNDGSVKVGFTAPSVGGQAAVVSEALGVAGVDAGSVGFVEAHGTGTVLGDPIEVRALTRAFRESGAVGDGFCWLGSVKSNFGHLDAAAGVAGLIKAVLCVRHGVVPPTLHFESPNPDIDFESSPFRVVRELVSWGGDGGPRRAGVSAFGFGGTNAHVVLEQAPEVVAGGGAAGDGAAGEGVEVVVLSARSESALEVLSDRVAGFLRSSDLGSLNSVVSGSVGLGDVAFTLGCGRRGFPFRRVVVGDGCGDVAGVLESRDGVRLVDGRVGGGVPGVVFVLSGQGSQYAGMGRELYEVESVFRGVVDECAGVLLPLLGVDVREFMFAEEGSVEAGELISRTDIAQPALFVLEYGLVRLWESWGVVPSGLVGHSLGELVAACVSGVFSLVDALGLVVVRGRLMQGMSAGAMVSVGAERSVVESLLLPGLSVAAHNGPRECVVSGSVELVERFVGLVGERGVAVRPVAGSWGFHSVLVDEVVDEWVAAVAGVERGVPRVPFVSNVTGAWVGEEVCDPEYWGRHARGCVEFWAGVDVAVGEGDVVVEVGPGQVLAGVVRRGVGDRVRLVTSCLPHRLDRRGAVECVRRAVGQLWSVGVEVDWAGFYQGRGRGRVGLPSYPFERKRFWLDPQSSLEDAFGRPNSELQQRRDDLADWFYLPSWQRDALPLSSAPSEPADWLIFADECGLGDALAERLRARGDRATLVRAGTAWAHTPGQDYVLDPADDTHHDTLVTTLNAEQRLPSHIVHGWSVTATGADSPDEKSTREHGFDSLLAFAKAIVRHGDGARRRMWVLSNGVQSVTGTEQLHPVKATVLGPCRVIPHEHPELACGSVDIEVDGPPRDRLLDQLLAEFATEPGPEAIAHRGPHRWRQHFVPWRVPAAQPSVLGRPGDAYLITGGTGGLGLALAEHLARSGAKLLLTARTEVPPAQEWAAWLSANPEAGRQTEVVRRLLRIQELGADLMVVHADVTDREAMRGAVEQAVRRWGRLDGAFHTAGVAGGGLIQLKSRQAAAEVLAPKVTGTMVLAEVLADVSPGFLVLFGSNAANTGDVGQVDYCAANCFLDAFAHASSGATRVVTVDWTSWREVGMAADATVPQALSEARESDLAAHGMAVTEGLEALDRLLANWPTPQAVVSPTDLSRLLADVFVLEDASRELSELPEPGPAHARPDLPSTYVEPRDDTERAICAAWQSLLGVDRVGIDDNFFDLGGNSLVAIQLINVINRKTGAALGVVQLYECLTVRRLAALLVQPEEAAPVVADQTALAERRQRIQQRREQQRRRQLTKSERNGHGEH